MSAPRLLPLLLACLAALAPVAAAATGPYAGTVRQGETDAHEYDNHPKHGACLQIVTRWTVTLAYAPATDVLTLEVEGLAATGANGLATLSFLAGVCTAFTVQVTGTSVATEAAYSVAVTSGPLGDVGGLEWG